MDDLSAVPSDSIIDCLLDRLQRGEIYTWVGPLLLAINPGDEISTESTYDLTSRAATEYDNVCDVTHKEVKPHIFAVAARAQCRLIRGIGRSSQVIVLNGETGTGKTFNASKALEFLTAGARHGPAAVEVEVRERDAVGEIVRRIADASRLIAAFTTAPTERNEVSSRHVQLVWLEYNKGNIRGAKISSYLLERDRVTKGSCNFQIFSQMMAALADIEFAGTGLRKDRGYRMLNDLTTDSSKGRQLRDRFQNVLKTMDALGFTRDRERDILQVLALLIHMGGIQFVQEDDRCKIDADNEQSKEALENTCALARLAEENVAELLTSILINPQSSWRRRSMYRRNLDTKDACRSRLHSIIRHLYDLLFHWLIDSINEILSVRSTGSRERLGILDIFGFECFDANGIEQLCVNYANERLQQYFARKYLESCRRDMQEEGLIDDEQPLEIVQLYEKRICALESQLFSALNDTCQSTVRSDSHALLRQMRNASNSHPVTGQFLRVRDENLVVRHYAGAVEYSASDLLSKNTDKIPNEMTMAFGTSGNKFLRILINEAELDCEKLRMKKPTMLSKLRCNMDSLIQKLNECDVHYVRCIKPRRLENRDWDRCELRQQLANTGILDALPLARCRYPIYFTHEEFLERYSLERLIESGDLNAACEKTLESYRPTTTTDANEPSVHYGKRLIFLTRVAFVRLECARRQRRVECVGKIESFWMRCRSKRAPIAEEHGKDAQQRRPGIGETCVPDDLNVTRTHVSIPSARGRDDDGDVSDYRQREAASNRCAESHRQRDAKENARENRDGTGAIVGANTRSDCSIPRETSRPVESTSSRLQLEIACVMRWLSNAVARIAMSIVRKCLVPDHRFDHHYGHFIDINCNNDVRPRYALASSGALPAPRRREKASVDRGKEEDAYVIQYDGSTFFYRNRMLSRRLLARAPIRVHTRFTRLANSHRSTHALLPRGLQDCL